MDEKRDCRILHEDLYISERNLHKYDYQRKIVKYIKDRREEMKVLVHLLDDFKWCDDTESVIYGHFHYARSLWVNGSITKEILFIFHDYIEHVAEAIATIFLSRSCIQWKTVYEESQELLDEVEKSHYNISNSS